MGGQTPSGTGATAAQSIVIDEPFAPAANWALETDDSFVLSKAGCLETLVKYETGGAIKPMLASSWKQTAPTTWNIKLRPGVRFQDGTPLDAKAVVGALKHALAAKTPAPGFSPETIDGLAAVNGSTVQITTPGPDALLPYRLASPNTGILAPKAYSGTSINPKGTCTGPFRITKEIPQQAIQLKRNSSYWGGSVKLTSAEVRFIADGAKRATQVQTGEAQISRKLSVPSVQDLKGNDAVTVQTEQLPRTTELVLNNKKAPFANEKVRQAFQAAIDTKAITNAVYQGAGRPAVGPFAPGEPWTPEEAVPVKADPAKARALLAEAGVKPGKIKVSLIAYNEGSGFSDLAAVIQQELKAVGVKATIRTGDYASVEPDLLSGGFQAALLSRNHLGDMPDPAGYLTADYTCKGNYNLSHYCDPKTDLLIEKAAATKDSKARYADYAKVAAELQSRAVDVFLAHETESVAVASGARGFTVHPYYTLTANLSLGTK
ncbi:ABC transporter substrate-binding protein [Streptomyces malaysiensis subsp. malaysiensis]|uniref:ABC transporter substrate-binding protein n=1 Tax=Streptomyces malaysiensis TaxID=92644 RepID=A0ABX6WLH1_STRMQ|nr:ABC transporter substrate-binding protein [Streptomyces solisilvae]